MAKYQANPVIVDAWKIVKVEAQLERGGKDDVAAMKLTHVVVRLDGEDDAVYIPPEMLARMTPVPGDYYVKQDDGYVYLNPKEKFEHKYSPVKPDITVLSSLEYRKDY